MILITLLFIAAILLGIRTNEIIHGEIILKISLEPVHIYAKTEGVLTTEYTDGDTIVRGSLIGIIRDDFDPVVIAHLHEKIDSLQQNSASVYQIHSLCIEFGGKDIGSEAERLLQQMDISIQKYRHSISDDAKFIGELKEGLTQKILLLEKEISSIYEADHLLKQEYKIDSLAFERSKLLLDNGSISIEEFEKQQKQLNTNELKRSLNKKDIESLRKQIREEKERVMRDENQLTTKINDEFLLVTEDLSQLQEHVTTLIENYFLYAPVDGIIANSKSPAELLC